MKSIGIPKSTFKFLKDVGKNNNREWFKENKERYLAEYDHMIAFSETLINEMSKYDDMTGNTPKGSLYRIYRDTRFSKNKTPYKTNLGGGLSRPTKWLRGGYYYSVEPGGNTIVAGGFFSPNSKDLLRIRKEFAQDSKPMRKIMKAAAFKKYFGTLSGKTLKTAPRGFDKDHPDIDLLRYKQLYLVRSFKDKEVMDDHFLKEVVKTFRAMRPYFNYMSEVLTTDLNGVPVND